MEGERRQTSEKECTDREKECVVSLADSFCCLYVIRTDFASFPFRCLPFVRFSDRALPFSFCFRSSRFGIYNFCICLCVRVYTQKTRFNSGQRQIRYVRVCVCASKQRAESTTACAQMGILSRVLAHINVQTYIHSHHVRISFHSQHSLIYLHTHRQARISTNTSVQCLDAFIVSIMHLSSTTTGRVLYSFHAHTDARFSFTHIIINSSCLRN